MSESSVRNLFFVIHCFYLTLVYFYVMNVSKFGFLLAFFLHVEKTLAFFGFFCSTFLWLFLAFFNHLLGFEHAQSSTNPGGNQYSKPDNHCHGRY